MFEVKGAEEVEAGLLSGGERKKERKGWLSRVVGTPFLVGFLFPSLAKGAVLLVSWISA